MLERIVQLSVRPIFARVPPRLAAPFMRVRFEFPYSRCSTYKWEAVERLELGEVAFLPITPWTIPVDLDPLKTQSEFSCSIEPDYICFDGERLDGLEADEVQWTGRMPLLDEQGLVNEGYTFFAVERTSTPSTNEQKQLHQRILSGLAALYNRSAECGKMAGDMRESVLAGVKKRSDTLTTNLDEYGVGMVVLHIRIVRMPKLSKLVTLPQGDMAEETEYLTQIPGTTNLVSVKNRGMPLSMRQMILKEEQGPQLISSRDGRNTAVQPPSSIRKAYPTPAASPFPSVAYRAARQIARPANEKRSEDPDFDITQLQIPSEARDRRPNLKLLWTDPEDEKDSGTLLIRPRFSQAALNILREDGIDVEKLTDTPHVAVRSRWKAVKSKQNSVLEVHGSCHSTTSAISARAKANRDSLQSPMRLSVQSSPVVCRACKSRKYCPLSINEKKRYGLLPGQNIQTNALQEDFATMEYSTLSNKIFAIIHELRGLEVQRPVALLQLLALKFRDHLPEACRVEETHGLFLTASVCYQLLTMPQTEAFTTPPVSKIISDALLANLSSWHQRQALLFFLIEHIAQSPESKVLARDDLGFHHPVSEFLHQTCRDALCGVQDADKSVECLGYLTEMFWMLCTEAIRLVQESSTSVIALKAKASSTEGLLLAFIEVADAMESDLPEGSLSFLRVFSCHQKFKETLVAVTSHITANRMDTAERRTDRMRQYLSSRSMQSLLPKNHQTSGSLSSTPIARTRPDRRASSVMFLQSDQTVNFESPSDEQADGAGTQVTAPLDEALDLPEVGTGVSLNWLQSQISARPPKRTNREAEGSSSSASGFLQNAVATFFGGGTETEQMEGAVADFEKRLWRALKETRCFGRDDLLPRSLEDTSERFHFPMPINAGLIFRGLDVHESFVIRSSKYPLVLTCKVSKVGEEEDEKTRQYQLMFKSKEDLRQDALIIKILNYFETEIFERLYGIDTHLSRYQVLPLSCQDGLIEFVPGSFAMSRLRGASDISLNSIVHGSEDVPPYKPESASSTSPLGIFIASSAAYSVMTYVLGVGDRHQDNLMVDKTGRFFHIDYGYIFGNDPKPFATVPMKITKEMIACMGGLESKGYENFCLQCVRIYHILRMHYRELVDLLSFTFHSQIPDVQRLRQQVILGEADGGLSDSEMRQKALGLFQHRVVERLRLELDEAEAFHFLINEVVNVSVRSVFPVVVDKLHDWAVYWR